MVMFDWTVQVPALASIPSSFPTTRGSEAELTLLHNLVGDSEQSRRDSKIQCIRRLGIDRQLELARLLDREVLGPRALEDATGEPDAHLDS